MAAQRTCVRPSPPVEPRVERQVERAVREGFEAAVSSAGLSEPDRRPHSRIRPILRRTSTMPCRAPLSWPHPSTLRVVASGSDNSTPPVVFHRPAGRHNEFVRTGRVHQEFPLEASQARLCRWWGSEGGRGCGRDRQRSALVCSSRGTMSPSMRPFSRAVRRGCVARGLAPYFLKSFPNIPPIVSGLVGVAGAFVGAVRML